MSTRQARHERESQDADRAPEHATARDATEQNGLGAAREHRARTPADVAILDFERMARKRILEAKTARERRGVYREVYEAWPKYVAGWNASRGFALDTGFGFRELYIRWFEPFLQTRRTLEVGCGEGYATGVLAGICRTVTGIDVSETLVARARQRVGSSATIVQADVADSLPFADGSFDAVYWNDVAEHLHPDDMRTALSEIRRVLRPRGVLCSVTCHLDDGPHDASMMELPRGSDPQGVHMQEFTYRSWQKLLGENGFDARMPIVGPAVLTKLLGAQAIGRCMVRRGVALACERTRVSIGSSVMRWLAGTNVIVSLGVRR